MTDDALRREAEAWAADQHGHCSHNGGCARNVEGCTYYPIDDSAGGYEAGVLAERPRAEQRGRVAGLEWVLTEQVTLDAGTPGGRATVILAKAVEVELARLRGGK